MGTCFVFQFGLFSAGESNLCEVWKEVACLVADRITGVQCGLQATQSMWAGVGCNEVENISVPGDQSTRISST